MDVDEDSDQNLDLPKLDMSVWVFNEGSICTYDKFQNFMDWSLYHLKCIGESV